MSPIRTAALSIAASVSLAVAPAAAQQAPDNPQIDYLGFLELAASLGEYREARRLPWGEFAAAARAEGAVLLDARSESAFAQGHLDGAVNLPFAEFTADKLAAVLGPDRERAIYIYCNNNFADDVPPVRMKKAELALNIPTFINLVGYGYANVWELADVVHTDGPGVAWIAAGG